MRFDWWEEFSSSFCVIANQNATLSVRRVFRAVDYLEDVFLVRLFFCDFNLILGDGVKKHHINGDGVNIPRMRYPCLLSVCWYLWPSFVWNVSLFWAVV